MPEIGTSTDTEKPKQSIFQRMGDMIKSGATAAYDAASNPLQALQRVKKFQETTGVLILSIITIIVIVLCIIYFLYIRSLQYTNCSFMDNIYGTINGSIRSLNYNDRLCQFQFNEYYIKTAYNCCSGGAYKNDFVSLCALKDVLKQGVRGLDFEIYSINDRPVVATSTTDNYYIKETYNSIDFADVMGVIRDYAFSNSTAPNPNDPVILHLRIKSTNQNMYQNFAKLFEGYDSLLLGKEYSYENHQENLGNRKLLDFMKKIVIIVDRSNLSFMECKDFYEYVNMTSNSMFMRALHYYDIAYTPDLNELIEYNKTNMTIGMPDKGANPPNPSSIVMREAGVQMLGMRYQNFDANLEENELFFNDCGYAFCLKPEKLRYIPIVIEVPPLPNQDVSYATRTVSSDYYSFDI
jgi:hypothetical protein